MVTLRNQPKNNIRCPMDLGEKEYEEDGQLARGCIILSLVFHVMYYDAHRMKVNEESFVDPMTKTDGKNEHENCSHQ